MHADKLVLPVIQIIGSYAYIKIKDTDRIDLFHPGIEMCIRDRNNPKRLAVIQGLKDCIVAESGNVLLICKKDDEQRIKQFVADAKIKYGKEYN